MQKNSSLWYIIIKLKERERDERGAVIEKGKSFNSEKMGEGDPKNFCHKNLNIGNQKENGQMPPQSLREN